MQVSKTELQHQVMIEAVENHMPEVIIIDEIGTELEALAARGIAEKGVQLVGTTHGNCLDNLIKNPTLTDLIGGIQYVTLSDEEAKRRGTQKSILERKAYPAFQIAIEINDQNSWTIHENVQNSIDLLLRGNLNYNQIRHSYRNQKISIKHQKLQPNFSSIFSGSSSTNARQELFKLNWSNVNYSNKEKSIANTNKKIYIYIYSLSFNLIQEVISKTRINFIITNDLKKANLILGFKKYLKKNIKLKKLVEQKKIPVYAVNTASIYQINKVLSTLL
jgi:hypothetical protein